jgi:hypothetical protein
MNTLICESIAEKEIMPKMHKNIFFSFFVAVEIPTWFLASVKEHTNQ